MFITRKKFFKYILSIIGIVIFLAIIFFSYQYSEKKKSRINFLNKKIVKLEKNRDNAPNEIGYIPLTFVEEKKIQIGNDLYKLKKYKTSLINFTTGFGGKGSSYLDYYENKLYLVTAKGIFSYNKLNKIEKSKSKLITINNNFDKIVNTDFFYKNTAYGIKDILISDDQIYVSFTDEIEKDCYNTSILKAKINEIFLDFKYFFKTNTCIKENAEDFFSPHQSGGRMVEFKNNSILFSIGEYRSRELSQKLDNVNGKIISIDKKTKKYKIISIGLRNPQGLFYDDVNDVIYLTDHGPQGGDEINLISEYNNITNFGWPISSYGEHYNYKTRDRSDSYKIAPLHKSHKKYGFKEPLKYFTPSIGISQLESINKKDLLVTSMGFNSNEGDLSFHLIKLKNGKIIKHEVINLNERIRDIISINDNKKFILFLESKPSLGILGLN